MTIGKTSGLTLCILLTATAFAQRGPQDNWVFDSGKSWETPTIQHSEGVAIGDGKVFVSDALGDQDITVFDPADGSIITNFGQGLFTQPRCMAYHSGKLFVVDSHTMIRVFSADGNTVTNWGDSGNSNGEFNSLSRIAADEDYVYTVEGADNRVQVFTHDGDFVRKWGSPGTEFPGQFISPSAIAVDRQYVYVADSYALQIGNRRIQVFDKEGNFIRMWNFPWTLPGCLAVDENNVYLTGGNPGSWIFIFDKQGNELDVFSDGSFNNIAVVNPYTYVTTGTLGLIRVFKRVNRTLGELEQNAPPLGSILNVVQREGTRILDIDYLVSDPDDTNLTVYTSAFFIEPGAVPSLDNVIPMHSFIEGTATNQGGNIGTEKTYRLSWDMETDGVGNHISDYGNLKVSLLVHDNRDHLDLHLLHLPAIGTNEALVINRTPLFDPDLLPVWFWWLASGDTNISLSAGNAYGEAGVYTGQVLASGTNTTALGRKYLFDRLGYRSATDAELRYAREATTPGSITKRPARQEPPFNNAMVNEFNFVTEPTNGWWVVPLP
ncbi:6-bladed beta-propeller [Pontiellaceae bacterium B12227]|nr:6-bladed beta-propeller [Pontiellaceae bacterium B12227]